MDNQRIELVQSSFAKVAPIADQAADIFYNRLFEIAPEVRPLFPAEMGDQKQKLMKTIGVAVNSLKQLETIVPVVQDLGKKHVGYGVKDEHYDIVGAALLYTLEVGLGDDWSEELKEAWAEVYGILATTMKDAAASA